MALTREFKDSIQARAQRDPVFCDALLAEGVDALLAGDVDTGKAVIRDYIKATVGFEKLSAATGVNAADVPIMPALRRPDVLD